MPTSKEGKEKTTVGERLADRVAAFGGSWKFIILFLTFMAVWIALNIYALFGHNFDPYPFILLNLLLSLVAALQAPLIMMSQNRQEKKDRVCSEHDYLINLKAEIEIRSLHDKIDLFIADQVSTLVKTQARQLEILDKLSANACSESNHTDVAA